MAALRATGKHRTGITSEGAEPGRSERRPQNRAGSGGRPPQQYQFKPGQSGNPGGRPRGFSRYIRQQTKDGTELVDLMVKVLRGEPVNGQRRKPTLRDRMDAATWLADRGFGKPSQPLEVETDSRPPFIIALREPLRIGGGPPERPGIPAKGTADGGREGHEEELLTLEPPPEERPWPEGV